MKPEDPIQGISGIGAGTKAQFVENTVAERAHRKPKGARREPHLRELDQLADELGRAFPFARERTIKFKQAIARAIQSDHLDERAHADDHDFVRAYLGRKFDGSIERCVRDGPVTAPNGGLDSDEIRARERLGRLWRNNEKAYLTAEHLKAIETAKIEDHRSGKANQTSAR